MFTDCAVALSTSPICSAMCMKRLLKISRRAGSPRAPPVARARPPVSSSSSSPPARARAHQPSSSTTVLCGSTISAGPGSSPRSAPSGISGTSCQPPNQARTRAGRPFGQRAAASAPHPPPRRAASTRTASITTASRSAAKPKRRRCSAWKRARTSSRSPRGTERATSLSPARSSSSRATRTWRASAAASSARAAASSSASAPCAAASPRCSRGWRRLARRTARRSATPMPNADSTLASGCTRMRRTPAARATRQACWPAAPPKQNSVKSAASSPRRAQTSRMALAIDSTPTSRNDSATVSAVQPPATCVAARAARAANFSATTRVSMRERPSRPKSARQRVGAQPSEQHLHVGEGEGTAAPVTGRPRVGGGGSRPHGEAAVAVGEDRAAAGGDGVHVEHRLGEAHPADQLLEALRQLAVDQ